jgi:gluconolactonase
VNEGPSGSAVRLPGPPEVLPGRPDAIVDLQTKEGVALVHGGWRFKEAEVRAIDFVGVGDDLGPSGPPNRTYDIYPHADSIDFDDSSWPVLAADATESRLGGGRVCFVWYRIGLTVPERVGDFDPTGSTAVFEVVVDDYAEVWVDGGLPLALGQTGGGVVGGFNAPNRVILGDGVRPGQRFQIAVLGINGPISASPSNYIWIRSATVDFYGPDRARAGRSVPATVTRAADVEGILPAELRAERVAEGFEFTEGPVWTRDGALLFSSPNTNAIYRWTPPGAVTVFRPKSGYSGPDVGRFKQPGSNGLTFDLDGRLTICQHGNRRIVRVEPRGNVTVIAASYDGKRLNSPNDLVYRSDGTLFFTDPPFGLPAMFDDPKKELAFSGVYRVRAGETILIDDELEGPNGIALSPDERHLYVGNWDMNHKIVMRYEIDDSGTAVDGSVLFDMTDTAEEVAIDGIKVDRRGNLYVCGPGGVWVLTPEGRHLATIELPEEPHNLAWGDADGKTLYVTALTSIYRVRLGITGVRPE